MRDPANTGGPRHRRRPLSGLVAAAGCALPLVAGAAAASEPTPADEPTGVTAEAPSAPSSDDDRRWRARFGPGGELYPPYIADPRRSNFRLLWMNVSRSTIPDAGNSRYGLRIGGRYAMFRVHRAERPERGFEIAVEAGFVGVFDRDRSTDNIGWDGLYGLHVAWADGRGLAVRLGLFHDSSHVGDEYAERTGRQRLDYTRQEYLAGLSRTFGARWRVYGEGAWAYDLRNEAIMQPGRAQLGVEHERPAPFGRGRLGWYTALDVSAYEENDWERNLTLQSGLVLRRSELGRTYRFGVELYDGRAHVGEFFQEQERYVAFGVWFDL